ncbi:MAG: PIN domain-containing protein [Chloroflexota bacterium]|nr:PIN domain-containing protein [Chloroflexota bacterium]
MRSSCGYGPRARPLDCAVSDALTSRSFGRHQRVGIDSNVLIYLLEGSSPLADTAGALLDALAAEEATGVLSALAVAEVATGPARLGDAAMVQRYADELTSLENVQVVAMDTGVAVEAALVRAGPLTLADVIHLATARLGGATAFVTNDRWVRSIDRLEVLYLDELDAADIDPRQ